MVQPLDPVAGLAPRKRRTETRKRQITEALGPAGSATPQDLASRFGVSIGTIHRDLDDLERRGMVRKFHGGVTAQPSGVFESSLSHRLVTMSDEKAAIAAVALSHVEPGMSILLDDSTTVLQMVDGLAERTPLHVATPFMTGLGRLSELTRDHDDLIVIGIGGRYDAAHDSFVGVQTNEQVRGLHVDALFMSTSAVSSTDMYHQEEQIMVLKREMLASASRRYLLVDHRKLGQKALLRIASLTELDLVITDEGASPDILKAWGDNGVPYEIARTSITDVG